MKLKIQILLLMITALSLYSQNSKDERAVYYSGDNGNGTYNNPIIHTDYSDPDVIRVGTDYYMTASSFNCVPGLPILHSKDLINWDLIAYAVNSLQSPFFDKPQHGKGVWAPSIRYHDAKYYIFFGDPDFGIYVTTADDPHGPWSKLKLVKNAIGWIDPCPLWDDDGNMYLIHAWAKSRVGFNSILTVRRMNPDNLTIYDDSVNVFDAHKNHPTIEGPKFYKKDGYYYIFAPAGGVEKGWQVALRSKNIYGPYEDKIVLEQGSTSINGPHQGAWVETPNGESWFIHFQKKGAYGRVIHLQPLAWEDGFPKIGLDFDGNLAGEPVTSYKKPSVKLSKKYNAESIKDEFNNSNLSLAWQWHANYKTDWYLINNQKGLLRLNSVNKPDGFQNMWDIPNLLLQKFPYEEFEITTELEFSPKSENEISGLIIMGKNYSYLAVKKENGKLKIVKTLCMNADNSGKEIVEESINIFKSKIYLKVSVRKSAVCLFYYSFDGKEYKTIGKEFSATEGMWIGAKTGIFALSDYDSKKSGYSDYEYFRIEKKK